MEYKEYITVKIATNVGASTPYDFETYSYRIELSSQVVNTQAHTKGFKEIAINVEDDSFVAKIDGKDYPFKRELHIASLEGSILDSNRKLNKTIAYNNYEVLSIVKRKRKITYRQ